MKYIIVQADYDDGDMVEKKSKIDDEQISKLKDILNHIQRQKGPGTIVYNSISWETLEQSNLSLEEQHPELSIHEINFLDHFCPSAQYGINTIGSIEIFDVINEEKLL